MGWGSAPRKASVNFGMPKSVGYLFGFGGRQTAQDFARCETDFNHFSAGFIFGVRPRCARAATTRRAVVPRWIADPDDVIYVHICDLTLRNPTRHDLAFVGASASRLWD